jgi:chemotaxis protein CheD
VEPADVVAPDTDQVTVSVADHGVSDSGVLRTSGLGSCLGIALYDPTVGIGGLVHPMLPHRDGDDRAPARYVDSGVDLLIEELAARGAKRDRLKARVTGGATVVDFEWGGDDADPIGHRNIAAAKVVLDAADIDIVAAETGGEHGRSMRFDLRTGRVVVERTDESRTVL